MNLRGNEMNIGYYKSPVGIIEIEEEDGKIVGLKFTNCAQVVDNSSEVIRKCEEQLAEYFVGKRKEFELEMVLKGTEFQQKVWRELAKIPYGKTVSYREIAQNVGNEKAVRAVGTAIGRNPIAIIVPCHRVIGTDGSMTGYAYGVELKRKLLDLEKGKSCEISV